MAGFGTGFIKGAVLSLIGVGTISLVFPLTTTDPGNKAQVDLPTPSGSGFNNERSDTNPVLPDTDQTVTAGGAPEADAPVSEDTVEAPVADTSSAERPATTGGVEMPMTAPDEDEVVIITPENDDIPITAPAALGVPMPEIDNPVAEIPVNRLPVIETPVTSIDPPETPTTDDSSTEPQDTPVEVAEAPSDATIETDPPLVPDAQTDESAEPGIEQPEKALLKNKIAFENPENNPLFSIVLIDTTNEGNERNALLTLSFPITFAVDIARKDAFAASDVFSLNGFEVVAMAPDGDAKLEAGEEAGDLEAALTALMNNTPMAVGLMDNPGAGIQQSTKLADQVIATFQETGHGLVTYDIGLNATDQKARRGGVKAGTIYRIIDQNQENSTVIKRYLDRAALEAGKDGHVIVLGHTYPETVTAVLGWALSAKSTNIALAPLSASLLSR